MTKVITYPHTERGTIDGDVYVCDGGDLKLFGVITGTLTVGLGGYAHVRGIVGNLAVQNAGGAVLDGICSGNARNSGGQLTVRGIVAGSTTGHVA
jgi:hypothetical protein